MRFTRLAIILAIPAMLFALAGCGSNSGGGVFNPTSLGTGGGTGGGGGGTGGTITSATMKLVTDRTSVDANIGQVLATATVTDANGAAIAGRPVTFSVAAGPATVDAASVTTDVNGIAQKVVLPGNALTTTNVIIKATTTVGTETITAYANFQLIRGTGIISFGSGFLQKVDATVSPDITNEIFHLQVPIKVTDGNGNPRVGVPVTLSVYSQTGASIVTIDYLTSPVTEPGQSTVTTDSNGEAIYNITINTPAPAPGLTYVDSIVFKAVNNDAFPITAYAGVMATVTKLLPALVIAPGSASFTTADTAGATRTFSVTGGKAPYSVVSSNPARVSVIISGGTITATLVDQSLWSEVVTITVTDQTGKTASATITRQ